jgi:hypothetical protein
MRSRDRQGDLIVLVADQHAESTIRGVLTRLDALRIRKLDFKILVHPEHDPGCYKRSHELLRYSVQQYDHGLVIFDREGCGRENVGPRDLEREVAARLEESGWGDRAAAVVLDPELEIWVWSDSPRVDDVLGWTGREPNLREWLVAKGFTRDSTGKFERPKEAMLVALREARKPHSSAMFRQLAQKVGLSRCTDPSFLELKRLLQTWFPNA